MMSLIRPKGKLILMAKRLIQSFLGLEKNMKNNFWIFIFLLLITCCLGLTVPAQTPTVEKIEPPNWWLNSTINPVRVLVRGKNFNGARVESADTTITVSNPKTSANGNYLFFDLTIKENAKVGDYQIKITTSQGTVNAPFGIFVQQPRLGHYQGYTPDDV